MTSGCDHDGRRGFSDGCQQEQAIYEKLRRTDRLICSTGKSVNWLSSPLCKNILLFRRPKSLLYPRRLVPSRGVSRSSRTRGGMRWTQAALLTRAPICGRRSRVVLMPRRWHQVGGSNSAIRRWQTSPVTGESTKETVKTIACGNAGIFRWTCGDYARVVIFSHARLRVHWAPGIPHALIFGADGSCIHSGAWRREIAGLCRPASSSRRTPGPITTGLCCCAKAVEQHLPKRATRRMGPGVRRDDGRRLPC